MTKNKQKWFKREIIERFMDQDRLQKFEDSYRQARIVNIGRETLINTYKK